MIGRIIEVASDGRYLSVERGFLQVNNKGQLIGQIPLDDISALIANAHGLSYSQNVLLAFSERGIPFVVCGQNHSPVAILWPIENHHRQAARVDAQICAKLPHKKRLWQQIVQSKISMQAAALEWRGLPEKALYRLAGQVQSGDASNAEGQAARLYWPLLMGKTFKRDRSEPGINALLNYGYTILRATAARHLIAAGLHPGISLFHKNEGNAMRLVDDVMEPFRPIVDMVVKELVCSGQTAVDAVSKPVLALIPTRSLRMPYGVSPVSLVLQRLCVSLAQAYENPKLKLAMPLGSRELLSALFDEYPEEQTQAPAA